MKISYEINITVEDCDELLRKIHRVVEGHNEGLGLPLEDFENRQVEYRHEMRDAIFSWVMNRLHASQLTIS